MSFTLTLLSRLSGYYSSKSIARLSALLFLASTTQVNMGRFTQADVRPFAENILMALFNNIEKGGTPEKIAENDYLMKCRWTMRTPHHLTLIGAMRVIITARQSLTPVYEPVLNRLVAIMGEISKNPSNPKFNQYCFESVSALIRSASRL